VFDLSGRVALVTGCGSARGIGFATARAMAEHGARVAITATSERVLDRERELTELGVEAWSGIADLTDPLAAGALAGQVQARFGRIDVLVNNAGMAQSGAAAADARFVDLGPEDWSTTIDRNLTTAANVTRAALPGMLQRGWGRVIFVSSVTGPLVSMPGDAGYSAAKAGLEGLMRALALEAGPAGVTVNAVAPGWIETASSTPAEVAAGRHTPVGRPGTPAEVAAAIVFLAAPESSYVNGHSLVVDGGNIVQEAKGGLIE
jgi:3-oxoacyl-[acyl-carrier protein] reductase